MKVSEKSVVYKIQKNVATESTKLRHLMTILILRYFSTVRHNSQTHRGIYYLYLHLKKLHNFIIFEFLVDFCGLRPRETTEELTGLIIILEEQRTRPFFISQKRLVHTIFYGKSSAVITKHFNYTSTTGFLGLFSASTERE